MGLIRDLLLTMEIKDLAIKNLQIICHLQAIHLVTKDLLHIQDLLQIILVEIKEDHLLILDLLQIILVGICKLQNKTK